MSLTQKPKAEVLPPHHSVALDTLAGVRGEMARLYRLALNGRIRSDEMTRFIYALKEIRACLEAEMLTDVQHRLALLSRDMKILHQPALSRSLPDRRTAQAEPSVEGRDCASWLSAAAGVCPEPDEAYCPLGDEPCEQHVFLLPAWI